MSLSTSNDLTLDRSRLTSLGNVGMGLMNGVKSIWGSCLRHPHA